ncbi:MAG: fibronectin type III domain-containing protein, partial [Bacteroidota bacterium]
MKDIHMESLRLIIRRYLFLISIILISCSKNPKSVNSVIDKAVKHIYTNVSSDSINSLSNEDVLRLFDEDELQVLATRYWSFDINTSAIVSVMRVNNQAIVPFWLEDNGFVKTGLTVKNEYTVYEVWQKEYSAGRVGLGINGFDNQNRHYFVSVKAIDKSKELILSNFFPENQFVGKMDVGSFTYHDWDELVLTEVPEELVGGKLLPTVRGRAREANLINAFRKTPFPSSDKPDQIMLTWSKDPKTTQSIQWRTNLSSNKGVVRYWKEDDSRKEYTQVEAKSKIMDDRMLYNDRTINRYTAVLENLDKNTSYSYIVGNNETDIWSDTAVFKTAADDSAPFSFTYFGDTHKTPHWGELID